MFSGQKTASKLTLRIDYRVIAGAKAYAKRRKTSVSKLVGGYLQTLGLKKKEKEPISPIVMEISGVLPISLDARALTDEYQCRLLEKYQ